MKTQKYLFLLFSFSLMHGLFGQVQHELKVDLNHALQGGPALSYELLVGDRWGYQLDLALFERLKFLPASVYFSTDPQKYPATALSVTAGARYYLTGSQDKVGIHVGPIVRVESQMWTHPGEESPRKFLDLGSTYQQKSWLVGGRFGFKGKLWRGLIIESDANIGVLLGPEKTSIKPEVRIMLGYKFGRRKSRKGA